MIKLLSQILIIASISGLVPVDAAQLEYHAGAGGGLEQGLLPVFSQEELFSSLPVADERPIDYPVKVDKDSYGIVTTAKSALVMDVDSGMMMYAKRPQQIRSIGSVTKLMSALIFLDQNPVLSRVVQLDSDQDLVYGGRIYLNFNDGISLEDLLGASLVGSDNSATKSLARFVDLTEEDFVAKMNEKARELGMVNTRFADLTGLDAGNVSTTHDLTKLLIAAESEVIVKKYMQSPAITVRQSSGTSIQIDNTNATLKSYLNEGDFSIEAGKTGFLPQAGYVLATIVGEGDHRIFVVVLGADSAEDRFVEVKGLSSWAFKTFKWPEE